MQISHLGISLLSGLDKWRNHSQAATGSLNPHKWSVSILAINFLGPVRAED